MLLAGNWNMATLDSCYQPRDGGADGQVSGFDDSTGRRQQGHRIAANIPAVSRRQPPSAAVNTILLRFRLHRWRWLRRSPSYFPPFPFKVN